MASKSYTLTPDQFAAKQAALVAAGAKLTCASTTTGVFIPPDRDEITLGYAYASGTLTVTVLHEAWYENADEIWSGLAPYLA